MQGVSWWGNEEGKGTGTYDGGRVRRETKLSRWPRVAGEDRGGHEGRVPVWNKNKKREYGGG